jgi:hypothetical protein
MKRLLKLALPVALLVVLAVGSNRVQAGCPASCDASYGEGCRGVRIWPYGGGIGGFDAWAFISVEPNRANIYPNGGFTAYDGMWATGFQAHSNYSPINWVVPPAANAQAVLLKLKEMNIPLVSPEPMFLNKNPRIADNVSLPTPRVKKDREKKVEDKEKE